ncbi:MAG: lytic transglycosylase domain-containing protein [Salibacteraceae bacterium]
MNRFSTSVAAFGLIIVASFTIIHLFTGSTFEGKEDEKFQENFENNYKIFALNLPDQIDFAGEKVPLNLIDVKEKLDRELLVNTYWQSQTLLLIKRSNRWFPVIEKILKQEGVPEDFKYLALIESGLTQIVSPAGATGFWQLMVDASRELDLEVNTTVDERYHIEKATHAACAYLKEAKEKFGSWTLAAASYNMGKSGVDRQLKRQKATNYYDLVLNEETERYIFRILAGKMILSNPKAFGFQFRDEDLYQPLKYNEVEIVETQDDLADFAFKNGINYKTLKFLNPWLRDNYLPVTKGKSYFIKLPTEPLSEQLVNDKAQVANFARSSEEGTDDNGQPNTTE